MPQAVEPSPSRKEIPTISSTEASSRGGSNIVAISLSFAAFWFALMGLIVITTTDSGSTSTTATAAGPVAVTLTEFKITPINITAAPGRVQLKVTNSGSQVHNLQIVSLNKKSPDLQPGASATMDLGELPEGTHEVICQIAGHADSGMKATLTISASATAGTDAAASSHDGMDHSTMTPADYAAMDKRMAEGMKKGLDTFVKGDSTKGVGNQILVPTIDAAGVKEFKLEASIVDWEVSAGKIVKAWAYNGMVPGPWIKTQPNDRVKVTITNNLPVSTDIHFHGISTPFEMDGVAPITQPAIKPGETFTYEWTNVDHAELGMYHAHDHGQIAVVNGLFAAFQVGDVALPAGQTIDGRTIPADLRVTQELPMVLNDAGVIGLTLNGKSYPSTAPVVAEVGDALLVHYYNEGLLSHPMHLHHMPQLVVAKDGFRLEQPYWADTINIAPGERFTVLVLPTSADVGVWAWHCHILNHAENADGLFGMVTAAIISDPTKPKA